MHLVDIYKEVITWENVCDCPSLKFSMRIGKPDCKKKQEKC